MNYRKIYIQLEEDLKNFSKGSIFSAISYGDEPFNIGVRTSIGQREFIPITQVKHKVIKITPAMVIEESIGGYVETETIWTEVYTELLKELGWDETSNDYPDLSYSATAEVKNAINKSIGIVYGKRWLCTDTYVGWGIITYDGKPFAIHIQNGRKCDVNIFFTDAEIAMNVKKFLQPFIKIKEIEIVSMDEDLTHWGNFI